MPPLNTAAIIKGMGTKKTNDLKTKPPTLDSLKKKYKKLEEIPPAFVNTAIRIHEKYQGRSEWMNYFEESEIYLEVTDQTQFRHRIMSKSIVKGAQLLQEAMGVAFTGTKQDFVKGLQDWQDNVLQSKANKSILDCIEAVGDWRGLNGRFALSENQLNTIVFKFSQRYIRRVGFTDIDQVRVFATNNSPKIMNKKSTTSSVIAHHDNQKKAVGFAPNEAVFPLSARWTKIYNQFRTILGWDVSVIVSWMQRVGQDIPYFENQAADEDSNSDRDSTNHDDPAKGSESDNKYGSKNSKKDSVNKAAATAADLSKSTTHGKSKTGNVAEKSTKSTIDNADPKAQASKKNKSKSFSNGGGSKSGCNKSSEYPMGSNHTDAMSSNGSAVNARANNNVDTDDDKQENNYFGAPKRFIMSPCAVSTVHGGDEVFNTNNSDEFGNGSDNKLASTNNTANAKSSHIFSPNPFRTSPLKKLTSDEIERLKRVSFFADANNVIRDRSLSENSLESRSSFHAHGDPNPKRKKQDGLNVNMNRDLNVLSDSSHGGSPVYGEFGGSSSGRLSFHDRMNDVDFKHDNESDEYSMSDHIRQADYDAGLSPGNRNNLNLNDDYNHGKRELNEDCGESMLKPISNKASFTKIFGLKSSVDQSKMNNLDAIKQFMLNSGMVSPDDFESEIENDHSTGHIESNAGNGRSNFSESQQKQHPPLSSTSIPVIKNGDKKKKKKKSKKSNKKDKEENNTIIKNNNKFDLRIRKKKTDGFRTPAEKILRSVLKADSNSSCFKLFQTLEPLLHLELFNRTAGDTLRLLKAVIQLDAEVEVLNTPQHRSNLEYPQFRQKIWQLFGKASCLSDPNMIQVVGELKTTLDSTTFISLQLLMNEFKFFADKFNFPNPAQHLYAFDRGVFSNDNPWMALFEADIDSSLSRLRSIVKTHISSIALCLQDIDPHTFCMSKTENSTVMTKCLEELSNELDALAELSGTELEYYHVLMKYIVGCCSKGEEVIRILSKEYVDAAAAVQKAIDEAPDSNSHAWFSDIVDTVHLIEQNGGDWVDQSNMIQVAELVEAHRFQDAKNVYKLNKGNDSPKKDNFYSHLLKMEKEFEDLSTGNFNMEELGPGVLADNSNPPSEKGKSDANKRSESSSEDNDSSSSSTSSSSESESEDVKKGRGKKGNQTVSAKKKPLNKSISRVSLSSGSGDAESDQ